MVFHTSDLTTCAEAAHKSLALIAAGKLQVYKGSFLDGLSCHGYNRPS